MRIPNRDTVEQIKKKYPPGTRIELISMKDPYSPVPPGTRGTVQIVDDAGTIHPKFDNGRTLGIIVGEDLLSAMLLFLVQEQLIRQICSVCS